MNNKDSYYNPAENSNDGTASSIRMARIQRKQDIKEIANDEKITIELEKQLKIAKELAKTHKDIQNIVSKAVVSQEQLNNFTVITDKNYEKYLDKSKEAVEYTKRLSEAIYRINYKDAIDDAEKLDKLTKKHNSDLYDYAGLLDIVNDKIETNKEANKSMLDSTIKALDGIKTELRDIALVKGVSDVASGIFGDSQYNMRSAYNATRTTLGLSTGEFNMFKKELISTLDRNNATFDIGWKDTAEYMSKLGELNITSQKMAEEQYLAVVQGTKYLGLSTDTQAKILKLSRDTGKADLLQKTNDTMVQIMNAQLGVSKDQLDAIINNATGVASLVDFLGGSGSDALNRLTKAQTAATNVFGKGAADAASNILQDMLNNPTNSQYLQYMPDDWFNILDLAQTGRTDEAYMRIIESIKSSDYGKVSSQDAITRSILGTDNNVMAITNSQGSMDDVRKNISSIEEQSSNINDLIDGMTTMQEKIENFVSNTLAKLPFSKYFDLQNLFYGVTIITSMLKLTRWSVKQLSILERIAFNTGMSSKALDPNSVPGIGGKISTIAAKVVPIMSILSGIAIGVKDASDALSKSKEWGTSKTSTAIGGFLGGSDSNNVMRILKNAGKYALVGAGIGALFFGIGAVPGAILGGLIGLALGAGTGAVGGKNIALGLDSVFGKPNTSVEKSGGGFTNHALNSPPPNNGRKIVNTGGKGGAGGYPWPISSPFGYRVLPNGDNSGHNGVDFGIPQGTPIGANVSGVVVDTVRSNANTYPNGPKTGGNVVYVKGDDGIYYTYMHLSRIDAKNGQRVKSGQLLGLSGNTGYSTGAHLHFGVTTDGFRSGYKNPENGYIKSGLFKASGGNYNGNYISEYGELQDDTTEFKQGERLLEKSVSADTMGKGGASYGKDNGENIVEAVNNGFSGLNDKLEELSNRQDTQEQTLRQLTGRFSSKAYQY